MARRIEDVLEDEKAAVAAAKADERHRQAVLAAEEHLNKEASFCRGKVTVFGPVRAVACFSSNGAAESFRVRISRLYRASRSGSEVTVHWMES